MTNEEIIAEYKEEYIEALKLGQQPQSKLDKMFNKALDKARVEGREERNRQGVLKAAQEYLKGKEAGRQSTQKEDKGWYLQAKSLELKLNAREAEHQEQVRKLKERLKDAIKDVNHNLKVKDINLQNHIMCSIITLLNVQYVVDEIFPDVSEKTASRETR